MFLNLAIHEFQIWDLDGDWTILIFFLVCDCVAEYQGWAKCTHEYEYKVWVHEKSTQSTE